MIHRLFYLVPELCLPTGLTEKMRADFQIMKEVGNFTRVPPQQRQDTVLNFMKRILGVGKTTVNIDG